MSLETRTSIKGCLKLLKPETVFKCSTRLSKSFDYKDPIPKDLISGVVYKFQCVLCNESYYGERIRHLHIHIGLSGQRRSNHQITVLLVIIYSAVTFYLLLTTLVFPLMKTKSIY